MVNAVILLECFGIGLNGTIMEECTNASRCAHAKDVQSAAQNLLAIINNAIKFTKEGCVRAGASINPAPLTLCCVARGSCRA